MRKLVLAVLFCAIAMSASAQTIQLPEGHDLSAPDRQPFALSPDGTRLVYLARATLFVKPVAAGEPVVVHGPLQGRNRTNPIFSPDGQNLLYWDSDDSLLQRVPVGGGTPVTLAKVANPFGLSWGTDGQVLIGAGENGVLRVPSGGGSVQTAINVAAGEAARMPQLLPDGDHVLFTLAEGTPINWAQTRIVVQSIKTGKRAVITSGRDARYLPSGQIVYVTGNSIMGAAFDANTLAITGEPVVIADGVQTANTTGSALFTVSQSGTVAFADARPVSVQLARVGLDGKRTPLGDVPPGTSAPRFSADGKMVTFAAAGQIYVADASNIAGAKKVISNGTFPLLSPDGQWLAFGTLGTSRENGEETIWLVRADGSGEPRLIVKPARAPENWVEGDQGFTFITHRGMANNYDVWAYSVSKKEVEPLAVVDESGQLSSALSPDRKWLAYMSSETGSWQVFIQAYPGLNGNGKKFQVTTTGGRSPMWVSDNQIVYDNDGQMYSVSVQFGDTPSFSAPSVLPITGYVQPLLRRNWDLKQDGQNSQFLMLFRPGAQINLISDWIDKLQPRSTRR